MPIVSSLVRAALFVSDLERSEFFYKSVLGIGESFAENGTQNKEFAELLGVKATSYIRYSILKIPGPARGMIGLFQVTEPRIPSVKRDLLTSNVGDVALVFYTDNIMALKQKLDDHDSQFICPPTILSVRKETRSLEMTFRDPDGIMINILEKDPLNLYQ